MRGPAGRTRQSCPAGPIAREIPPFADENEVALPGTEPANFAASMRAHGFSGASAVAGALFAAGLLFAGAAPAQSPPVPAAPPPAEDTAPSASASAAPEGLPPPAPPPVAPLPHYVRTFHKGQGLLEAGRHIEAAYELATALRDAMADPGVQRDLPLQISTVLQLARSRIGVLYVKADEGLEVKVDGVAVGAAPVLGEVLVTPGKHRIIARGELCLGTTDVDVLAGETRTVKVPCSTAPVWRTPALIIGLSTAAVGLAVGGITLSVSEDRRKEIDRYVEDARSGGYVPPWMANQVAGMERNRVDLLNMSITSFLIGGALLAGTTGVFFGVKRRRPDEPAPLVGATVGVGQAGLWMRW